MVGRLSGRQSEQRGATSSKLSGMLIPLEALQHCGFVRQEPRRTDTLGRDVTGLTGLHDDSDWIEWRGGEMPVDGETKVQVRYRNGSESTPNLIQALKASDCQHYWPLRDKPTAIIAYRVVAKEQM